MNKDKTEIVRGYVEREIEYAKTIANPNTSRGDKIWAYHCLGGNNMGVVFQLNKLKREQQSQRLNIGGVVHMVDDMSMVISDRDEKVNVDKNTSQTITIKVPNFDDDLCEKIRGALSQQDITI